MIADALIDDVAAEVTERGATEQTVMALRAKWPEVHFTYCMDDDVIGNEPVRCVGTFNLYLVDAHQHCLTITDNKGMATGLAIAEKLEGEDDGP